MNYKVSYRSYWDKTGMHYDQTISLYIPQKKLSDINMAIISKKNLTNGTSKIYFHVLKEGLNYTTHTTRNTVIAFLGIENDKRILDRNTIIKVILQKN